MPENTPEKNSSAMRGFKHKVSTNLDNARNISSPFQAGKSLFLSGKALFRNAELIDFVFILLVMFACIKDLFDVVFFALPPIQIIISFVMDILYLSFSAAVLFITGGSQVGKAERKVLKYLATLIAGFIVELIPGLNFIPVTAIETLVLYVFVLYDRELSHNYEENEANEYGHNNGLEEFA